MRNLPDVVAERKHVTLTAADRIAVCNLVRSNIICKTFKLLVKRERITEWTDPDTLKKKTRLDLVPCINITMSNPDGGFRVYDVLEAIFTGNTEICRNHSEWIGEYLECVQELRDKDAEKF